MMTQGMSWFIQWYRVMYRRDPPANQSIRSDHASAPLPRRGGILAVEAISPETGAFSTRDLRTAKRAARPRDHPVVRAYRCRRVTRLVTRPRAVERDETSDGSPVNRFAFATD